MGFKEERLATRWKTLAAGWRVVDGREHAGNLEALVKVRKAKSLNQEAARELWERDIHKVM